MDNTAKKTDIIFISHDDMLIDNIISYLTFRKKSLKAEKYNHPAGFLDNRQKYQKDTKICICHRDFDGVKNYGVELVKSLYEDGYKKLYLFTGYARDSLGNIPNYLTVMLKGDLDAIDVLLQP